MPVPSKVQVNVCDVVWTPISGTPVEFQRSTIVRFNDGGQLLEISGDCDMGDSFVAGVSVKPTLAITNYDVAAAITIGSFSRGSLSYKMPDGKNGMGVGCIEALATNAIIANRDIGASHRAAAEAAINVSTEMPDGVTFPIAFSVVTV